VSDHEAPEGQSAFRQLEQLVRHLGDELAMFRKRALQAEARVRTLESVTQPGDLFSEQRVRAMELEAADLRARLRFASERTQRVLDQVRFVRQQHVRAANER
jgi:hypothetical protein